MPRLWDAYAGGADAMTEAGAVDVPAPVATGDVLFSSLEGTFARTAQPAMRYNSYARTLVEDRAKRLEQATGVAAQQWTDDYMEHSPFSDSGLLYRPSRRATGLRAAMRAGTITKGQDGKLVGTTAEAGALLEGNDDYASRLFTLETLAKDPRAGIVADDGIEDAIQQAIGTDVGRMTDASARSRGLVQGTTEFLGAAAGQLAADPDLIVGGAAVGVAGAPVVAAARTMAAKIGRSAALEGAAGLFTQLPVEIDAMRLNQALRVPYSGREAAVNVLAATLFGAGIGALIPPVAAIAQRWQFDIQLADVYAKAKGENPRVRTPEADLAEAALRDAAEIHAAVPELPPAAAQLHATIEAKARDDLDAGETPRIEQAVLAMQQAAPMDTLKTPLGRILTTNDLTAFDPRALEVNAELFQFKSGGDEFGVTERLRDVGEFQPAQAGTVLVWEDAAGKRFIVDGHQRMGIARRAIAGGQDPQTVFLPGYVMRESDGVTPEWARTVAAIKNIGEGTGTAVDAAKLYRDASPETLAAMPELSANSALARDGRNLSKLSDEAFGVVVNDVVKPEQAAVVGELIKDGSEQMAALDVLRRSEPANAAEARAIVEQVRAVGFTRRAEASQGGLFSDVEFASSLFKERARILTRAVAEIRKDLATFRTLIKRSGKIRQAGNVLADSKNLAKVAEDEQVIAEIQRLANAPGEISDALNAGARRYADGEKLGAAVEAFLEPVRAAATRRGGARPVAREGQPGAHEPALNEQGGAWFDERGVERAPPGALTAADRQIENRLALQVADVEAAEKLYAALPDAKAGKVLNTDTARELSADYLADRTKSAAVHGPASWLVKQLYARRLAAEPAADEIPLVLFTAGGTGAGKTTAVGAVPRVRTLADEAQIIYDTNMGSVASSRTKIDQALAAGKGVQVALVVRDPVDALVNGALPRAMRQKGKFGSGRTVPIYDHAETHVGAIDTFHELRAAYAGDERVHFLAIDNTRGAAKAAEIITLDDISPISYTELEPRLFAALEHEHETGKISDDVYRGFKAETDPRAAGQDRSLAQGDRQGSGRQPEQGRPRGSGDRQGLDLLGEDTRAAQALADETAKRDQARSAGQVSLETGDPTDLFSVARKQADIFDEAQAEKALRQADEIILDDPEILVTIADEAGVERTIPASRLFEDLDLEERALRDVALCATPGEA